MARLSIPDEQTFAEFTVATPTTVFPITFRLISGKSDLTVLVDGVALDGSAYGFTGMLLDGGGYAGGTVTLNTAVDDVTLRIERNVSPARTSQFAPSNSVPVGVMDMALNRLTASQQDIKRSKAERPYDRADKLLGFDADGDEIAVSGGIDVTPATAVGLAVVQAANAQAARTAIGADLAANVNLPGVGTGGVTRPLDDVLNDLPVSVLRYGAAGDGTTDDSAAIQAAVDANKGKAIILPAGYTFLAAGIILSGSSYNGTTLIVEGTFLLKAVLVGQANFQGVMWDGIVFHDCEGCTLDVRGMMDGNRLNQAPSQQVHLLYLAGARKVSIPQFKCREIRGDGITINIKQFDTPSTNCSDITIGFISAVNSADDGRNALSVISCERLTVGGGVSTNVGGTIAGERMPGGFDIEPDDATRHLVTRVRSGPWVVQTAGTSGIACIGHPITNDATADWNVQDVYIAPSVVTQTSADIGGPIFKRNRRVTADVTLVRTGGRSAGIGIDYQDFSNIRCRAKGVSSGVTVGAEGFTNDCSIHVEVEDHSGPGLQVQGANRTRFTGYVRGAVAGSAYGVQIAPGARGTLTQTNNVYAVDVPYDANNSYAFLVSAGMTLTACSVADCAFLGYSNFAAMFGFAVELRTRNVTGRNNASAVPADGFWAAGDIILNDAAAAGATPGWVCTTGGQVGSGAVFKAMASLAA